MTAGGHVGRLLHDDAMTGTAQGTFDVTVQPGAAELDGTGSRTAERPEDGENSPLRIADGQG